MRPSKRAIRIVFVGLVLLLAAPLVNGYVAGETDVSDRYEIPNASVEPRDGVTVVTTSPRSSAEASLVAFAPNGSVLHYDEQYDYYFDVDPVAGESGVVEYVAVELVTENCDRRSQISRNKACSRNVVERVDLRTGETTRIHSYLTRPKDIGGWHDVDRVDEDHLLVAGSTNDRVFLVNTSSEIVEWQWNVQSAFDTESGGLFPSDWAHLNDVELLADGRIMVSLRNQDQVVFLDRGTGVVSNWTLGEEDNYDVLFEQHNPDYVPESQGGPAVLVADSHNNRVVEYQRENGGERTDGSRVSSDASDGAWEQTWAWSDLQLQWPRDADRLPNGHTLIADSNGNRVLEIDRQGNVVWEIPMDTPYEVERLGTGDESAGGESARRLGLGSQTSEQSNELSGSSITVDLLGDVKNLLPRFVVNGLIFLLPAWVTFVDLLVLAGLLAVANTWLLAEFRWSAYTVRSPIGRA